MSNRTEYIVLQRDRGDSVSLGLIKRRSSMLGYEWCTVSGTSNISLPNSMESNFRNIKILGNSRYKTYAGTNLLDVKLYDQNKTDNGVTFETQVDGSTIVSGNSTGVSTFYLGEYIDLLEDGKSYIYKSDSPNGTLKITFTDGTPNDYVFKITVDKSRMSSIKPCIQFNMTNPLNGIRHLYPILNEGIVAKPWEPATGGKPVTKQSPDIPLEIESCGYRGKNLLDFKTAKLGDEVTKVEMLDNGFTLNATNGTDRIIICKCDLKAGKTYVLSYKANKISGNDNSLVKQYFPETGQYFLLNRPFVPNQDVSKVGIYVDASHVPAKFEVTDIQVEEGTTATPYEPYSDKYFVDLKVTGRNILNSDSGYSIFTPFYAKAGTKFTMITNGIESAGGNIRFIGEDGSDVWFAIDKGRMKSTIIIKENVKGFTNELIIKDGLKYSMVIGDTDEYEPYVDKTVQIALDKPLYKADRWYNYGTSRDALKKRRRYTMF